MSTEQTPSSGAMCEALSGHATLNDPATVHGILRLVDKLAPLLQSDRLHNVVDVLSALADVVDFADDALVQKLTKNFEVYSAAAFNTNNALNYAVDQASGQQSLPSLWQLFRRLGRDEDTRRGLVVALELMALMGRQARQNAMTMPDD